MYAYSKLFRNTVDTVHLSWNHYLTKFDSIYHIFGEYVFLVTRVMII